MSKLPAKPCDQLGCLLRDKSKPWQVVHIDVTCDGCEVEPIVGVRYKCRKCHDRDLCEKCVRGLVAARATLARLEQQNSDGSVSTQNEDLVAQCRSIQRAAQAVPCLDPSHKFQVVEGPERMVHHFCRMVPHQAPSDTNVHGNAALSVFLDAFPPAQCSASTLAWISVGALGTGANESESFGNVSERAVDKALAAWDRWIGSQERVTPATVDRIADKYNLLEGKWMIFCSHDLVDDIWRRVAVAVSRGQLGHSAKVSSTAPLAPEHVLCVYTKNYKDAGDMDRVANALAGILKGVWSGTIRYKPDIYTYLGIYRGNDQGLAPTVQSRVVS